MVSVEEGAEIGRFDESWSITPFESTPLASESLSTMKSWDGGVAWSFWVLEAFPTSVGL